MAVRLTFAVDFHGPVRVGTGRAAPGRDDTVDPTRVPASTLKGLMRAEARRLFPPARVDAAFGVGRRPTAWHWSDLTFTENQDTAVTARLRIDEDTHSAAHGGLFRTEHLWPAGGGFQITRMAALTGVDERDQADVLTAAALAVHNIGADRTRGYGWVSVRPAHAAVTQEFLDRVLALATPPGGDR